MLLSFNLCIFSITFKFLSLLFLTRFYPLKTAVQSVESSWFFLKLFTGERLYLFLIMNPGNGSSIFLPLKSILITTTISLHGVCEGQLWCIAGSPCHFRHGSCNLQNCKLKFDEFKFILPDIGFLSF